MPKIRKLIDCSQPLYHNAPRYVGNPPLEYNPHFYFMAQNRSNVEFVKMTTHTGTHLDAPYHMVEGGKRLGDFALTDFAGEAILLDASLISGKHIALKDLQPRYDTKIKAGDIVIIRTGFGERRGYNDDWLKNFPSLTVECAQWLVSKKIKGVGIDVIGFEGFDSAPNLPIHHTLLPAGLWLIEELYLPREVLERERWWFMALPLRFDDAGGSPTRAVLIDWEDS